MSTDIKRSKAQLSNIIQSDWFLGALLDKFVSPLIKVPIPLDKHVLAPLGTMALASEIESAIQRQIRGWGVLKAGKGVTLVISNEDMVDITRITKSLENSAALIDGVSEIVKHELRRKEVGFLA